MFDRFMRNPLLLLNAFVLLLILNASAKAGEVKAGLDMIDQFCDGGGILGVDTTTSCEDFDFDWTKDTARDREISFSLQLGRLYWTKGTYPSPLGPIVVNFANVPMDGSNRNELLRMGFNSTCNRLTSR